MQSNRNLSWTIFLLCLSYALDFYNLSIYSVAYRDIAESVFGLTATEDIEKMRITVNNWQNLGVVLGAFLFGPLGDKWGRVAVLKVSIFLYSVATFAGLFVNDLPLFIALRFICGVGLACEFSISSVLIAESAPANKANWYSTMLYASGILGGLCSSILGFSSWKLLFYIGSFGGIVILLLRSRLRESAIFLKFSQQKSTREGQIRKLWRPQNRYLTLKFFLTNIGFHLLISYMFLYPSRMKLELEPGIAVKMLLLYFFIGGIIGTVIVGYYINIWRNYTRYLLVNYLLCIPLCVVFPWVNQSFFAPYCIVLGILAGGIPVAGVQLIARSYGANIRSTASNLLFGLGRSANVGINIGLAMFLNHAYLTEIMLISAVIIFGLASIIVSRIKDTYTQSPDFLEN